MVENKFRTEFLSLPGTYRHGTFLRIISTKQEGGASTVRYRTVRWKDNAPIAAKLLVADYNKSKARANMRAPSLDLTPFK